jgi:hypothetical protein
MAAVQLTVLDPSVGVQLRQETSEGYKVVYAEAIDLLENHEQHKGICRVCRAFDLEVDPGFASISGLTESSKQKARATEFDGYVYWNSVDPCAGCNDLRDTDSLCRGLLGFLEAYRTRNEQLYGSQRFAAMKQALLQEQFLPEMHELFSRKNGIDVAVITFEADTVRGNVLAKY